MKVPSILSEAFAFILPVNHLSIHADHRPEFEYVRELFEIPYDSSENWLSTVISGNMQPLSAAASVIACHQLVSEVGRQCLRYIRGVRHALKDANLGVAQI